MVKYGTAIVCMFLYVLTLEGRRYDLSVGNSPYYPPPGQPVTPLAGQKNSVTVFIHGTLFPFVSLFVRAFDCPLGLIPARMQGNKFIHGRIPYILNEADPRQFPLDSFYLFGWSGRLTFFARKRAAHQLYLYLRHFRGDITLIGHSHGGTVALHLPEVAAAYGDSEFTVDRLILMGVPVLAVTENNVLSKRFNKVIVLYSLGDSTQILDPQGFYQETRDYSKETGKPVPWLSKRFFPSGPNIIQRRCLLGRRNFEHLDFIFAPFVTRFAQVVRLVERSFMAGLKNTAEHEFMINVPREDHRTAPELLVRKRGSRNILPRPQYVKDFSLQGSLVV